MPNISIIIPVYNVERYLRRCLDSVIAQTFSDWEAICVDDGSTDTCPKILDEYAARDQRFKILHKTNGGLSSARNAAMPFAAGEYTVYIDSDDFIHPQTLEICLYMARRDNSDLVAYSYHHAYRTSTLIKHHLFIPEPKHIKFPKYTPETLPSKVVDDIFNWSSDIDYEGVCPDRKWLIKHCNVWRRMYRTEIIKGIKFVDGILYEDFPWWSEVMLHVKKATIINLPLYYYYPNMKGIIFHSKKERKIESFRKGIAAAEALYKESATVSQMEKWEKNFLLPFKRMLAKKEKNA